MSKLTTVYKPLVHDKTNYEGIYAPSFSYLLRAANGYPSHEEPEEKIFKSGDITLKAFNMYLLYGALKEAAFPAVPLLFLPDAYFSKMSEMVRLLRMHRSLVIDSEIIQLRAIEYAETPWTTEALHKLWTSSCNLRFTLEILNNPNLEGKDKLEDFFSTKELAVFSTPQSLQTDYQLIVENNVKKAKTVKIDSPYKFQENKITQIIQKSLCSQ